MSRFHQSFFLFEESQPFLNEKGFMFLQMSRFHQSFFLFEESQPFQPKKDFCGLDEIRTRTHAP